MFLLPPGYSSCFYNYAENPRICLQEIIHFINGSGEIFGNALIHWMIEFWKGQYGITTGAEVGIYVEKERGREEDPADVFYQCVSQEEELPVSMILYKNGKRIFRREKRHWWLTGFFLGEFSWPSELMLEVSLTFPDMEMLEAFLEGCYRAGYRQEDLHIYHMKNKPAHYE